MNKIWIIVDHNAPPRDRYVVMGNLPATIDFAVGLGFKSARLVIRDDIGMTYSYMKGLPGNGINLEVHCTVVG